jgi:transcriptional regulator with XRE-family HTH domain
MQRRTDETVRRRFGRLVADAARQSGKYDIDGQGGKAKLARDTGLSESAVGRMLRGETLPDPRRFESIAQAVGVPVRQLLIEAEIVSVESLSQEPHTGQSQVGSRSITPDEAADAFGLTDPVAREMLYAAIERQRRMSKGADDEQPEQRGGTAAQM